MKKKYFRYDRLKVYFCYKKNNELTFFKKITILITNFGLHCIFVYRFGQIAQRLYRKNKVLGFIPLIFYFILNFQMRLFHHVELDRNARIGPGFFILHASNIFIGPVIIGENCSVTHNVTIGQGIANGDRGVPEIGDNVWIGTGATIVGSIKIGNDSTISMGSFLSKDIPDRSLVAGNPGRIISWDYDNSAFKSRLSEIDDIFSLK